MTTHALLPMIGATPAGAHRNRWMPAAFAVGTFVFLLTAIFLMISPSGANAGIARGGGTYLTSTTAGTPVAQGHYIACRERETPGTTIFREYWTGPYATLALARAAYPAYVSKVFGLTAPIAVWKCSGAFVGTLTSADPYGYTAASVFGTTVLNWTTDDAVINQLAADSMGWMLAAQDTYVAGTPPTNTTLPRISLSWSSARVGSTATVEAGSWLGYPTSTTYRWQRCTTATTGCTDISAATGAQYTVQSADLGKHLRVNETATNAGGNRTATSVTVGPASSASPTNAWAATFESGANIWSSNWSGFSGTISTERAHSGTSAYRLKSTGFIGTGTSVGATTTLVSRFNVNFATLPSSSMGLYAVDLTDSPIRQVVFGMDASRRPYIEYWEGTGGCQCVRGGDNAFAAITPNRWYLIDLRTTLKSNGTTNDSVTTEWFVDGVNQGSMTYDWNATLGLGAGIVLTNQGIASFDAYVDDVQVSRSSTDFPIGGVRGSAGAAP